jgi:4-hydroxy-2-oxoheptanedioate aldolase
MMIDGMASFLHFPSRADTGTSGRPASDSTDGSLPVNTSSNTVTYGTPSSSAARSIETAGSAVTPIIRIPPNGGEMSQWFAKQVLDIGAYGVVWPHVSTAEEAYNAVAACRYPRPKTAENYEPEGQRGDSPVTAARYWGLTQQAYYAKADVWPLNPNGEILVIIMCEEVKAIDNLPEILKQVQGIGLVLIGEGDLSQNLGYPRQYDHPVVVEAMAEIRRICKEYNMPVGHPHVDAQNAEKCIQDGYRFLMAAPGRSFAGLDACRKLTGRV